MTIVRPGVYQIDEADYHAHAALSSTGARPLANDCPADYDNRRSHPQAPKQEFDLGSAAHKLVLGAGPEIVVVGPDEWRTNAAKEAVAAARAKGQIPLKPRDFDTVMAMADALRRHPDADEVFAPAGSAEQSLFWTDFETGVFCRARPDWIGNGITDYKSTTDVSIPHLQKVVAERGYHQQADWYLSGAVDRDLIAPDAPFRLVFQAKTAPYLVTIVELDDVALQIGRDLNRYALETFHNCTTAGNWPGHTQGIEVISLPAWTERRHFEGAPA
jgi:PDDEXK-like domain of unknown function (DUF3799)